MISIAGANLERSDGRNPMRSGWPRHLHASAHDSRHVLTFQGKSCSLFRSYTLLVKDEFAGILIKAATQIAKTIRRGE
jgi:hypothetical protein